MSGEKKLLATDSPHPVQGNSVRVISNKKHRVAERSHWSEKKTGTIHEKYTVIRKDHCLHQNTANKGVKQKVPVKRLRDGH